MIRLIVKRLSQEYWDQPQSERDDDHEFLFMIVSLLLAEHLIGQYPTIRSVLGPSLALLTTAGLIAFVFVTGIWPYIATRVASMYRAILWSLRIGWDYECDTNRYAGLTSERWRQRHTGEIRYANSQH